MRMLSGLGHSKYFPLVVVFTLAVFQSCQKGPDEMSREELEKELSNTETYDAILTFANNTGIKTDKFSSDGEKAPVFKLLEEVGYGHKPALKYTEKVVKADTTELRKVAEEIAGGQSVDKVLAKLEPVFPVYHNLKTHYTRLVKENKTDSAAMVAKSLNAYRWIKRQSKDAPRFVMVNIRGAYLTAMDSAGQNVLSMRTVVGKNDTQTPTIDTYATSIVTHPYWNVPKSIAIKEMFPKAMNDPEYLSRNRIEIIDNKGQVVDPADIKWDELTAEKFPYRFRQETGGDNSLGLLKVEIKNPLAIYLHDTNARYLFNSNQRWRSHGCVRVQRPTDLANYMAGDKILDNDFMTEPDTTSVPPKWHKLKTRVPVFLFYLGADCNEKGQLLYFPDVYKIEASSRTDLSFSRVKPARSGEDLK
ncbi:L,D-transpeptidase family protein [Dyadobacter flavalbus]|uniref:L,D-transpeptidase family protein n=2 Tax=Dyadobacter flavalbus TaxID=2579942 RepID=A0A5M8QPS1_9BACT|nr:L,D-transpeptidase family protein [Dyadobacter flavalbus]